MMFKKAQVGPKELVLTIVLAGLLFVVGIMIFANVSNTTNAIFDNVNKRVTNEALTITSDTDQDHNSSLLGQKGYITNSEIVKNASGAQRVLVRNVDYTIGLIGGTSGQLVTQGNFTLLNVTNTTSGSNTPDIGFNNTALFVTYSRNAESDGKIASTTIQTTVLDSFSLGVIALIVLAAVVILAVLFKLGTA